MYSYSGHHASRLLLHPSMRPLISWLVCKSIALGIILSLQANGMDLKEPRSSAGVMLPPASSVDGRRAPIGLRKLTSSVAERMRASSSAEQSQWLTNSKLFRVLPTWLLCRLIIAVPGCAGFCGWFYVIWICCVGLCATEMSIPLLRRPDCNEQTASTPMLLQTVVACNARGSVGPRYRLMNFE